MVHDAPQFGVVLADDPGDGLDRHGRHHGHHHGLEQQVKPLSGRAHGAAIFLTPHFSQRTRGTRAFR